MRTTPRFPSLSTSFSLTQLRTSFRRSSSPGGKNNSSSSRGSFQSMGSARSSSSSSSPVAASPVETINSIMHRQPSLLDLEEERKNFGSELDVLEPRPIVYWGGVEERMGGFAGI